MASKRSVHSYSIYYYIKGGVCSYMCGIILIRIWVAEPYLPPILKINVTSINIIKFNQNNAVEMLINDSYIHIFYIVFMNAVAVYKLFVYLVWNVGFPAKGGSYIYRMFE